MESTSTSSDEDMTAHDAHQPSPEDAGLHCPGCHYNLTGLSEDRCPECGRDFDRAELRRLKHGPSWIGFESAAGWRRVPAFGLTWLTVMFAPWVFARQARGHIGLPHALLFGVVCFAFTLFSFLFDADLTTLATWLSTALIYLIFQTTFLTLIEPSGWRFPLRTSRFWALIGCYTSAVMCTEFVHGPPLLAISEVAKFVLGRQADWPDWLGWLQLGLWLMGPACCYFARMRRAGADRFSAGAASCLIAVCLFLLYGATVEYIGVNWLYGFFGGKF
ncbi:MAG: zf-TFIIB domain-containing protein [Planctomycetes bacterium]|nr:zf-TFIIB domain-containing protein [Planctomycetota bacterium]